VFKFISINAIPILLINYGYLIFLLLAIVEGPIVTIIGGFLSSLGYFHFLLIYLLALVGNLGCDFLYYILGRWGNERIMAKGHFWGINIERAKKIEKHFGEHAGKTILFGKWTHYAGAPILVAAGMARIPLKKFVWFNFVGESLKSLVLLMAGYYFGKAYQEVYKYLGYVSLIIFFVIILIIAIYLYGKNFLHHSSIQ